MNKDMVLDEIKRRIMRAGSQSAVASELGISASLLSEILTGRRGLSAKVIERLGFVRIDVFIKASKLDRAIKSIKDIEGVSYQ